MNGSGNDNNRGGFSFSGPRFEQQKNGQGVTGELAQLSYRTQKGSEHSFKLAAFDFGASLNSNKVGLMGTFDVAGYSRTSPQEAVKASYSIGRGGGASWEHDAEKQRATVSLYPFRGKKGVELSYSTKPREFSRDSTAEFHFHNPF